MKCPRCGGYRKNPLCEKCFLDPCECPCEKCGFNPCRCRCALCGHAPEGEGFGWAMNLEGRACKCLCHGWNQPKLRFNPADPAESLEREWLAHLYGVDTELLDDMPWLEPKHYCIFCEEMTPFKNNRCQICGGPYEML